MRLKLILKGRTLKRALRQEYRFKSLRIVEHPLQAVFNPADRNTWRVSIIRLDGKEVLFDVLPAGRRSYNLCYPNDDAAKSWQSVDLWDDLQEPPPLQAIN